MKSTKERQQKGRKKFTISPETPQDYKFNENAKKYLQVFIRQKIEEVQSKLMKMKISNDYKYKSQINLLRMKKGQNNRRIKVTVHHAILTNNPSSAQKIAPYVTLRMGEKKFRTQLQKSLEPKWEETFEFNTYEAFLIVKVKDKNFGWIQKEGLDYHVGRVDISFVQQALKGENLQGYFSLQNQGKPAGKIYLSIQIKQ